MPKKAESKGAALDSTIETLLDLGSKTGSVTEDDIQIALKDIEVTDAELNSIYGKLRDKGVEVVSADEGEQSELAADDRLDDDVDERLDDDDFDGEESDEDHDLKIAKNADAEMASTKSKKKARPRTSRSAARARGIDASTVMLTGDPVRMYLKEIGKVDLLTAAERRDMTIQATRDAARVRELAKAVEGIADPFRDTAE